MGRMVNFFLFLSVRVLLMLFLLSQPVFSYIESGGNPYSPTYISVVSSPPGLLTMQVTYSNQQMTSISHINNLGATPLASLHVDEGWQRLYVGKNYNQRSSCEQGLVTPPFQLNRFNNVSASFNFVTKGNYFDRSFGDDGSGIKKLIKPQGIYADIKNGNGYLYIANTGNNRIHIERCRDGQFSYSGGYAVDLGSVTRIVRPGTPYDIVVDTTSIFLVGKDTESNNVIQKYNKSDLILVKKVQLDEFPRSMAMDNAGNIYVVHRDANSISKWDNNLGYIGSFGSKGNSNGQFNSPNDIAIDDNGNIYVADTGNDRIQIFDQKFNHLKSIKELLNIRGKFDVYSSTDTKPITLNNPTSLAIDKFRPNVIYVVSGDNDFYPFTNRMIYTIDTMAKITGERIISFYRGSQSSIPYGITIDSDNTLYQTDTVKSKITVFKPSLSPLGSLSGSIIDQTSLKPVKNVIVKLKKQNTYFSKDSYKLQTDENGTFAIHDLVEGVYSLTVEADRYPIYNSNAIEITNNTTFDAGSIAIGPKKPLFAIIKTGTGTGTITSSDGAIDCGNTCSKAYDIGAEPITLTATQGSDSTFTEWSGCPSADGNQCIVTINDDVNVTAKFTIKPCTYSFSTRNVALPSNAGSGSIDVIVHSTDGGICNWQAQRHHPMGFLGVLAHQEAFRLSRLERIFLLPGTATERYTNQRQELPGRTHLELMEWYRESPMEMVYSLR
jgi:5-hydroxyisourate hydrolase-like protein (transthyretin family)